MIFIKNPIAGKVKTRLGNDIGHDKAVEYYQKLLTITREAANNTQADKWLWYGDFINSGDAWPETDFTKKLQAGNDLGARMKHAFQEAFAQGYRKVCIIGSDCPEMSAEIVEQAFFELEKNDAVIGPANDGGYYLLGMKKLLPIFDNIQWSTETVLTDTIGRLQKLQYSIYILKELTDLDTVEDLKLFPEL